MLKLNCYINYESGNNMLVRNCAGGIVFYRDTVLLLCNDKHEWAFPKGVVRAGQKLTEVAVGRIKEEAGVDAKILTPCGKTYYEFYSITRQKPVHNNISWFVMKADTDKITILEDSGIIAGEYFSIEAAMQEITYSQDHSLLMMAYQRYKELI